MKGLYDVDDGETGAGEGSYLIPWEDLESHETKTKEGRNRIPRTIPL